MRHDSLVDALSKIKNAEKIGKRKCSVCKNTITIAVLDVFKKYGYIGGYDLTEKTARVELIGRINECKGIRPRFPIMKKEYEKFEQRHLPAKDVGLLVISTSKGVMSQTEAIEKNLGGRLLAVIY
ncbi:MAG: 30S ribosomal protein S8 [Candidatus Aenigmatarchaeota archaeon]